MILRGASAVYGTIAGLRRRWYATGFGGARTLHRPVVSVGNLRVGGSGKTPFVEHLVRLLVDGGERPVILSRGYGRSTRRPGVTVVSNTSHVIGELASSGDEPLMLARKLPGVPVLVADDRYAAGAAAEERFDVTVHVLDDGFQHLRLKRDVDLLLLSEADLDDRPLPAGRLRERLTTAAAADAVLVIGREGDDTGARRVREATGVETVFAVTRQLRPLEWVAGETGGRAPDGGSAFAVAAIARPDRFFQDATAAGIRLAGTRTFRDHHQFTAGEMADVMAGARAAGADMILMTEKDAVRLMNLDLPAFPIAVLPLALATDQAFIDWLTARLNAAKRSGSPAMRA